MCRKKISLIHIVLVFGLMKASILAQVSIEKIEPPNWWTPSTVNPIRILLTGKNLYSKKVSVKTNSPELTASNLKSSENGHYLFFDLKFSSKLKPGKYKITVQSISKPEKAEFEFEIFPKSSSQGRNQGFTPDDVIYFLLPDRFADGDPSNNDPPKSKGLYNRRYGRYYHGGDLQGIIDKLDYIRSLGATAIWTTPIYDNNDKPDYKEVYEDAPFTTGYHGYGPVDFYAVDEHFGDIEKLKELVQKAHSIGLKVIQDQIANHTGPYHRWAEDPPTPTWWNGTVQNHLSNNWQKWTTMNPRATYQTQRRNLEGWFINILPDFNQNDPEVERYLVQNSLWWLEMVGFDGIRMDTLPHVPRSFWEKWGAAIKREFPKVTILGELYDGNPALLSYFQTGRRGHDGIDTRIDTLFDFALFYSIRNAFAQGKAIREVSQVFAHDWLYPNPSVLVTFIGVHDMPRFMNEPGATIEGLKLAQTLIMTSRGTPIIYYGDEIAMPGGGDPDNRRDFPGGFPGDARNAFTAEGRTPEENEVWNHLAKLGALRKELEPPRRGRTLDLLDEEQQMAYARVTDKEAVLIVINNDTKPARVSFDVSMIKTLPKNGVLVDRLGKVSDVRIENGIVDFIIQARTGAIFTLKL